MVQERGKPYTSIMLSFDSIEFTSFRDAIKTGAIADYAIYDYGFIGNSLDKECFIAAFSDEHIDRILDKAPDDASYFFVRGERLARTLVSRHGYQMPKEYLEYVYPRESISFDKGKYDIRCLDLSYFDIVSSIYHVVDDFYKREMILEHKVFGIFDDDNLMGFIGEHHEGGMGMLEILPEYRRKGLGYILESFMIDRALSSGRNAYCNVLVGNTGSIALQEKLGMTRTELTTWWIDNV